MKEEKIEKHVFYVENGKLLHKTKEEYEIIEDIEVKRCESKIDIDEKRIKASGYINEETGKLSEEKIEELDLLRNRYYLENIQKYREHRLENIRKRRKPRKKRNSIDNIFFFIKLYKRRLVRKIILDLEKGPIKEIEFEEFPKDFQYMEMRDYLVRLNKRREKNKIMFKKVRKIWNNICLFMCLIYAIIFHLSYSNVTHLGKIEKCEVSKFCFLAISVIAVVWLTVPMVIKVYTIKKFGKEINYMNYRMRLPDIKNRYYMEKFNLRELVTKNLKVLKEQLSIVENLSGVSSLEKETIEEKKERLARQEMIRETIRLRDGGI